jgi:hypothetical protein
LTVGSRTTVDSPVFSRKDVGGSGIACENLGWRVGCLRTGGP